MADLITAPPKPNPIATRVQVTCSSCMFFAHMRLPTATAPCSKMGCPPQRAPCARLAPAVFSEDVGTALDDKAIRAALNSVPDTALGALAIALPQVARLRAAGYKLGERVYFNAVGNATGRDFIGNYYRGRVMMLNQNGDVVISGNGVSAIIEPNSVLKADKWEAKRQALVIKKAFFDPKSPFTWERKDIALLNKPKYRPPWLNNAVAVYRASYAEAKATRQTHDYDSAPVKRGRGRPRKDGSPPKSVTKTRVTDVSASA